MRSRRNSALNVETELRVRRARFRMSSREQSREIRTSSHRAPPLIKSFAFTSAIFITSDVKFTRMYLENLIRDEKSHYHAVPSGIVQVQCDA